MSALFMVLEEDEMTASRAALRLVACAISLLVAAGASVTAQELRGRINGVVTDNTGAVIPGVTVTATSSALIQPQVQVTGDDGTYRFPALPSGVYTVTFEVSGFQTLRREEIRVGLNQTLTVDAQLQISTLQETVTITGESPVVDVTSTTVGTNFAKELLQDIPNARDIWAVMAQAPGIQMTGYDVGGSHTGTQTGYMFYGTAGQNKTLLEGINVTEGQDANAGYFDFGSFEEFQIGSGAMGEQQGPGALLNITVKSGGDRWNAQVYYDYEDENTISDNILPEFKQPGGVGPKGFKAPTLIDPATRQPLGLQSANPIVKQYDFNVNGGGPIVKSRAWFFASYRDNNQYRTILGLPGEEAQSQLVNKTIKGTYQLSRSNQLIYFYNERSKLQPLRDLSLAIPVSAAHYQDSKNRPQKLEWTSVLSSRAFLDVQYSHWGNFFPLYPTQTQSQSVEGVPVGRLETTTSQRSGAMDYYHYRTTLKPQLSASLSYFMEGRGTHNLKVGFEGYRERRKFLRFQPENIYYRDTNGIPAEVDIYNTPNEGIDDSNLIGIYAQDEWALKRGFTINYGVRFDRYTLGWPEQSFTPEQTQYFQPVSTGNTTVAEFTSISPRIGVAWDLIGDGKSVVKVHYGRYYFNPSTDLSSLENPVGQAAIRYRFVPCSATVTTACDVNGNRLVDSPAELGARLQTIGGAGFVTIDRDLDHPYGQGVTTSFERELADSLSVRGLYAYKAQRKGWAEVDRARYNAYTIPVSFLDVGPDNIAGTPDDQTLNLLDRAAGVPEDRFLTNPHKFSGVPEFAGDYHTIEFGLNRRFKDRWLLMTSFEHTWADDFRNTGAGTSNLAVARQATFEPLAAASRTILWMPNRSRLGRQETTYWNYKLVGRYVFPYDIGVSSSYKLQSGFHWARAISVPGTTLRNAGTEEILAEPVNANRSENVHILDFRFEKGIKLSRVGRVTGMVDIFNITNANPITNFRVVTGPRFKEVISILDPRIVRFGVRWDF
jgi:hypothetical protein